MPIMLCTHDRCLWVATMVPRQFEGATLHCWSVDTHLPGCGSASQLIKGLSIRIRAARRLWGSFVTQFDDGSPWQTFEEAIVAEVWVGREGRGGGSYRVEQGGEHTASSVAKISTWHQTPQHIKRRRTPPPCVSHFISSPFSLPLLPRKRGWCRPLTLGGGDAKSSPVSPLSHSWWAWHKKKEKWEPCWEREG